MLDVSVIIGFKDWGLDRLNITLSQLVPQTKAENGEVIVVDYGSANPKEIVEVVEANGARVVRVDTTGPWSRARALNAGTQDATGKVIITTDADMLFSPNAIKGIITRLQKDPHRASILQCKDLPEKMGSEYFAEGEIDWYECEANAVFRPRYGMGGMIACTREAFLHIRGFDERMHTYGGEDMDFAERLRRSGHRFDWIVDPEVSIYHIWHPSSRAASEKEEEGAEAIARNASILQRDKSVVRNLVNWQYRPNDAKPAATVVIVTHNRLAFLKESIASVYLQTVQDFQLIVVDDGSEDGTADYLASINESRFTYLRQEKAGIAAARNLAAEYVQADWVVIHDDDDIMLPDRIESHFASLSAGVDGTYGGWVDFDDFQGGNYTVNTGRDFTPEGPRFTGGIFVHGTLMLRANLLALIPYDETFRSGSDYNLALRLIRSGLNLKHFGGIAILRRLHPKQVTHSDSSYQRASWSISKQFAHPGASAAQINFKKRHTDQAPKSGVLNGKTAESLLEAYGPDSWAEPRNLIFTGDKAIPGDIKKRSDWVRIGPGNKILGNSEGYLHGSLQNATLDDAQRMAVAGFNVRFSSVDVESVTATFSDLVSFVSRFFISTAEETLLLIGEGVSPEDAPSEIIELETASGMTELFVADLSEVSHHLALEYANSHEGSSVLISNGGLK